MTHPSKILTNLEKYLYRQGPAPLSYETNHLSKATHVSQATDASDDFVKKNMKEFGLEDGAKTVSAKAKAIGKAKPLSPSDQVMKNINPTPSIKEPSNQYSVEQIGSN